MSTKKKIASCVGLIMFFAISSNLGFRPHAWAQQAPTKLKVGIIPIASMLPFFTAIEKGFFKQERVEIESIPMAGGAVILPAIAGGSVHLGYSAVVSVMLAREKGFDFKIISHVNDNNTVYTPGKGRGYKGHFAIMVKTNSPISNAKDLEGKSVGVNTINSVDWVFSNEWMEKNGANPKKVNWIEVPFPKMMGALAGGKLDGIAEVEPFITILLSGGKAKVIDYVFSAIKPKFPIASFVASDTWIGGNREMVERFARANEKGLAYINAHFDEAPEIIGRYTRVKAALAKKIVHGRWPGKINIEELQWIADLLVKRGMLKRRMDVNQVVHYTAR